MSSANSMKKFASVPAMSLVCGILPRSAPRLLTKVLHGVRDLLVGIFSGRVLRFGFLVADSMGLILLVLIILGRGASGEWQERKNKRENLCNPKPGFDLRSRMPIAAPQPQLSIWQATTM
jgi:hypothetical protein